MINLDLLNALYKNQRDRLAEILPATPHTVKPVVTQTDASTGFILRYFVRPANDITFIVEVDKQQFERFKNNPRFITASVKWKIVGHINTHILPWGSKVYGVEDLNRQEISSADLTFGGLMNYITNYKEYWISEV